MHRFILVALACALVACSGDSTAPQQTGIAGQWIYRVSQLTDGGAVACTMINVDTLTLSRSTESIAGRYSGGAISCRSGEDTETITMVAGAVVNGTVDAMVSGAQNVSFDLDGTYWHQTGSLSGDRMSGTLTIDHGFAGQLGNLHLTGTWTANRTSASTPRPQPK
ncbi:MAG TPA: hypothetical protein VK617_13605 [Gemmatimonadaceae bacterium]|nr:hypothetical protein [Gemmatimonadaceae bacterium]